MKAVKGIRTMVLFVALLGGCGEPEEDPIDSLNPNTPSVAPVITSDSMEIEAPQD